MKITPKLFEEKVRTLVQESLPEFKKHFTLEDKMPKLMQELFIETHTAKLVKKIVELTDQLVTETYNISKK